MSPSLNCDSPLDQRIKGELISDLFSMACIVPLEQRKVGQSEIVVAKSKGMYYGAYEGLPKAATTTHCTLQRQASSASTKKGRRLLPDNSGFSSSSNSMMVQSNLVDKKAKKQLIKEAEMEFKLRGKFKRVFPSIDYHYYK